MNIRTGLNSSNKQLSQQGEEQLPGPTVWLSPDKSWGTVMPGHLPCCRFSPHSDSSCRFFRSIPTPPPQCPPPPPYTYIHLRGPAHSLLPARAFQSQDPAPTASEAPKPCNQPAPRSGRPGTKGGKGGKQSSFPFSTPKPAQALSTLAPEMSPTDFLPASSGRWYRDCRSCKGGKEQERRLGWEKELG